jgi:30S ribosomal protein S31
MGKGDKKTRRGKINIGSYGVRRRRKNKRKTAVKPLLIEQPLTPQVLEMTTSEVVEVAPQPKKIKKKSVKEPVKEEKPKTSKPKKKAAEATGETPKEKKTKKK